MKRFMLGGLSTAAILFALGFAGCGGSGIDEGIPRDTTPPPPPEGVQLKMGNIKAPPAGKVGGTPPPAKTQ